MAIPFKQPIALVTHFIVYYMTSVCKKYVYSLSLTNSYYYTLSHMIM